MAQFHNMLIYVLLAAAGVTLVPGELADTAVIVGVVLVNALIGFVQEGRAERAMDSIRRMLRVRARVLRCGDVCEVDAGSWLMIVAAALPVLFVVEGEKALFRRRHAHGRNRKVA